MREGWKCPACSRILSPDVQSCLFCGGSGSMAARVRPLGDGGAGSYAVTGTSMTTLPHPAGWTGNVQMVAEAG